ncbi:MAG: hypothetical protein ACOYL6_18380 [Bacteriovoracaceae bacterium]
MAKNNKPIFHQSTQEIFDNLKYIENHIGQSFLDLSLDKQEVVSVSIRPDLNVPLALFMPDEQNPLGHKAHPDTIRAMRKDLFISDPDLLDRSLPYTCEGCKHQLDLQFWLLCPYCGKEFKC